MKEKGGGFYLNAWKEEMLLGAKDGDDSKVSEMIIILPKDVILSK